MKTKRIFKTLLLSTAMLFAFTACDDDNKPPVPLPIEDGVYVGVVKVDQGDGITFFTQESVELITDIDTEGRQMSFLMKGVKFSDRMPVSLDMTVKGVSAIQSGTKMALLGDNIIPEAMGGPFPRYTITNLTGDITDTKIKFAMTCGDYPLVFEGELKQ